MEYTQLGKTGLRVSKLALGTFNFGPFADADASFALMNAAVEAGINLFDTADAYGMGRSEEIVGKVLGKRPDDLYVATKVGNWGRRFDDDVLPFKSVHSIYESCHASLYRLKTDRIDLYQCHIQKPEHPEVFVEAFEELKKEGKIREYAISTDNLDALKAMNANNGCASCQIRYSILDRSAEKELFPYCLENNIGVLLRGPLAMGVLTGKFSPETTFDDSVRERWNEGEAHENFLRRVEIAEKLKELVNEDRSLLDIALQFPLTQPAVTCSIPGMKNADQARANTASVRSELSHEDLATINGICPPGVDL